MKDKPVSIYNADCLEGLPDIESGTIDLVATDPPYGIGFMGKDWDKALPDKRVWAECLRVLKPGAFAFVMCIPRQDCLAHMIVNLGEAGFETGFTSMYWTYASGFPKAGNIGKQVDKRNGGEREVIGQKECGYQVSISKKRHEEGYRPNLTNATKLVDITAPSTPEAKALDGSYAGFQPKPAVEVILVAMKPLSKKTYVDQALDNGKGITWLDDCRIPYESEPNLTNERYKYNINNSQNEIYNKKGDLPPQEMRTQGRFPANLLVSDDVLNDGKVTKSSGGKSGHTGAYGGGYKEEYYKGANPGLGDSGSFSRYFDLDKWYNKTFPFLITPKASKSEKNKGCEDLPLGEPPASARSKPAEGRQSPLGKPRANSHPTVKPLKLMSYLITLGSREGDTVVDPYVGSGSTCLAASMLGRKSIGYETDKGYFEIAVERNNKSV